MNKWNALLNALNAVYGYAGSKSTFKPVNRYFNQNTGEMVTVIEFKAKRQGEVVVKNNQATVAQKQVGLLQNILRQVSTKEK